VTIAGAAVTTGVLLALPIIIIAIWVRLGRSGKQPGQDEGVVSGSKRRNLGRLPAGEPIQTEDYYIPILQALVECGGGGEMDTVLRRVGEIMRGTLRQVDYESLPSKPDEPRWWNKAQWARNAMVHKLGWMREGSPTGYWEISDLGRRHLQETQAKSPLP
jgi:hypothetical protein